MAEEPIIFPVTDDGGTAKLIALFEELGVVGEGALGRLNAVLPDYVNEARAAADAQQILNTYIAAGGSAVTVLEDALAQLSEVQLQAAASNTELATALQNIGVAEQAAVLRVTQAQEQLAASTKTMNDLIVQSAIAEEEAVSAALAQEDEAYSIHSAYVKEQATAAAYSINAAYDSITASAVKVSAAMTAAATSGAAAQKVADDLRVQAALEAEAEISNALRQEEAAWAEHAAFTKEQAQAEAVSINASYDLIAAGAAKVGEAMLAAATSGAAAEKAANDLRVQAAIEAENAISQALKTEDAAWAEHAAFIKEQATTEAFAINAAMDAEAASSRIAQDLRVQAAIEAELKISAGLKAEEAAWAEHANFVKGAANETAASVVAAAEKEAAAAAAAGEKVGASLAGMGSSFLATAKQIGLFVGVTATIHDINALDSIKQQLQSVIGPGKDTDAVFQQLSQTAIATQQPLETVAKSFTSIYAAIKENGGTVATAVGDVDSLSKALFVTQTPAAAAQRVLHDFSEGLATGSLNGRQLTSILMQAPQVMALFSDALGKNVESLSPHAIATQNAAHKLADMEAALNNTTESLNTAKSQYTETAGKVTTLTTEYDKQNTKLAELATSQGTSSAAYKAQQAAIDKTQNSLTLERNALGANGAAASVAADAAYKLKQAKVEQQASLVANASALSTDTINATLNGDKFKGILNDLAATAGGTVSGAFVALNDKFEIYLKQTGDASAITKAFNVVLGVIGNLIPEIVPALVTYGAVIAGLKIKALVADINLWTQSTKVQTAAQLALDFAMNPTVGLIVGIGVAVAAVITYFGQWQNILAGLKVIWDDTVAVWNVVVTALGDAFGYVVEQITPIVQTLMPAWNDLVKTATGIWDQFKDGIKNLGTELGLTDDQMKFVNDTTNAVSAAFQKAKPYIEALFGATIQGIAQTFVDILKVIIETVDGIITAVQKAIGFFQTLFGLQAQSAGTNTSTNGSNGGAPLSRDGSQFTVGGSSGVDSQMIRVSPGEHVTIQTPMQKKMGYVNDNLPKFREGGRFNVDTNGAAFVAATNGSTTGYGVVSPDAYYTSGTTTATDTSTSTATASDSTVSDNTDAVIDLSNTLAAGPSLYGGGTVTGGGNGNPSNPYDGSYTGGYGTGGGSSGGGDTSSSGDTSGVLVGGATPAQNDAKSAAIAADNAAFAAASVITAISGISRPSANSVMTDQQSTVWVSVNGNVVPKSGLNPNTYTYAGDRISAQKKLIDDQNKPASQFRDGGDFTVPGSSGVDSRMIQLAVSPGETLSIRTPQQKQAQQDMLNGGRKQLQTPVVNVNITATDANSFSKSQAQIASQLKRQLSKVA